MFTINPIFLKIHSTYVPSARALFSTIDRVYNRISQLRGFREMYQFASAYPRVRLYYAYAFFIRVLTVMRSFNALSYDQTRALDLILDSYPLSSFHIAEPFVPFFEALCGFTPSDGRFGPVYPYLPATGSTAARHGALSNELMMLLPNFVSIAKACAAISNPLPAAAPVNYFADLDDPTALAVIPAAHNAPGLNSFRKIAIGSDTLAGNSYSGAPVRNLVRESLLGDQFVPIHNNGAGINADHDVDNWTSYLLLTNGPAHIGRLAAVSEFMNIPFSGNKTLADLPNIDGPFGSVTFSYDNRGIAYANANASRAAITPTLSLQGRATFHEAPEMIDSARASGKFISNDQALLATIAQVNVILPANYGPGSNNIGAFNGTRFGPYWDPAHLNAFATTAPMNTDDHIESVLAIKLSTSTLAKRAE